FNRSPAQPCNATRSTSLALTARSAATGAQARDPFVSSLPVLLTSALSSSWDGVAPLKSIWLTVRSRALTTMGATSGKEASSKRSPASASLKLPSFTVHGLPVSALEGGAEDWDA